MEDDNAFVKKSNTGSTTPESTDSSFSWKQFQAKVNNELANNIGNFINKANLCYKTQPSSNAD